MTAPDNLRLRLRYDTREAHQRLDDSAGGLDLAKLDDAGAFMAAHAAAYHSLKPHSALGRLILGGRLQRASKDLTILGLPIPRAQTLKTLEVADDLALLYVISGSHLGAKQLDRQRARSQDSRVRNAHHLLTDPVAPKIWREVVQDLRALPACGARADAIVASANAIFDHFKLAFDHAGKLHSGIVNVRA